MSTTTKYALTTDGSARSVKRMPQGVPASVPYVPTSTSTIDYESGFAAKRIIHVSAASGTVEYVHLWVTPSSTSSDNAVVTIEVIPSNELIMLPGASMACTRWPLKDRAIAFTVRGTQPAPQQILQGFLLHSGSALSIYSRNAGILFYGFVVVEQ